MGVGAYTGADQPTVPADDGWAAPVEDKPVPPGTPAPSPPPLGRGARAILVLAVVLVAALVVIAMLAFVVPAQYSEHQTLTLDSELGWHQAVCVPDQDLSGSVTTNVSFTWSTTGTSSVTVRASYTVWPAGSWSPGIQIVYNGSGTSGRGWYTSGPYPGNDGVEFFDALGFSGPLISPVYVNVSYELPGHYLGGPSTGPPCGG
jgi:hypothetical protein